MSIVNQVVTMFLMVGAFFSGSSRELSSMADQAGKSTTLSSLKDCRGGGCGGTCEH